MDINAMINESMLKEENEKICPFRSAVGSKCVKEHCALWHNDDGSNINGCALLYISKGIAHIAMSGIEVFPS